MTAIHVLHGRDSSIAIESVPGGAPLWRYWGPRLRDGEAIPLIAAERHHRGFHLDAPARLSVLPGAGLGWFSRSGLLAHRDGADFACGWDEARIEPSEGRLDIHLRDTVARLSATVTLAMCPESDVLSVSTTLGNDGEQPLDVQWLASGVLPLPPAVDTVRYYAGRHANEFGLHQDRLGVATWSRENRHGITSHEAFPGAVAVAGTTGEHSGMAYGAQLAWTGNHGQAIDWLDDGRRQWQLGMGLAPGELRLAPGESIAAPAVLATFSGLGWQGVARNFHAAARQRLSWPDGVMRPRPVHLNTWEGCYFDHDEARLIALADRAAALGVERFVLDDGWFHRRSDDHRALGDWWPDAAKYPQGLKPLADHVVARGMEFGLWIEPEMVNPDSELYRAHPDWVLGLAGRPQQLSRNQLVLDLTRDEVADYLFDRIGKTLTDLPVSYLKWDHNRDLVAAGDAAGRAAYRRQVLGLYRLIERFRHEFPSIEIESCAGGGGRIDVGILPYVHRFWASDCLDALSRLDIQRGFLQFLPPETMGAHVGTAPAHTTGRSQPLDFRAAVALQGHFGIELDPAVLSEADIRRLAAWVAFYKLWRPLLHATVWQGDLGDGLCWHAAGGAAEWIAIVYRTQPTRQRFAPAFAMPFADANATYRVVQIAPGWEGKAATIGGSWLAQAGLPIPPLQAEQVAIFHGKQR